MQQFKQYIIQQASYCFNEQ